MLVYVCCLGEREILFSVIGFGVILMWVLLIMWIMEKVVFCVSMFLVIWLRNFMLVNEILLLCFRLVVVDRVMVVKWLLMLILLLLLFSCYVIGLKDCVLDIVMLVVVDLVSIGSFGECRILLKLVIWCWMVLLWYVFLGMCLKILCLVRL